MIAALAVEPDDFADAHEYLRMLWLPGEVREVRIPKYNEWGQTAAGWFDDPDEIARCAEPWDGQANVYITLNPVDKALLARANRRIARKASATTADGDIVRRRWLPIDIDPVRPSGISSTDLELEAAREVFEAVTAFLRAEGWADPIIAMSGNGYNALYPIGLPNDTAATELVRGVLKALATRFDSTGAHVDVSVSNAARIIGLVGFMKVKGDKTEDRPHRRSALEAVPSTLGTVTAEQLEAVAQLLKTEEPWPAPHPPRHHPGDTLVAVLEQAGIAFRTQPADAAGITWYHVERCPFHDDGRPFECGVGQKLPDGPFAGKCFHPEGDGKGWKGWKAALRLGRVRSLQSVSSPAGSQREIRISQRFLHDMVADAWAAVTESNVPPTLFCHAGAFAEVRFEDGLPRIHHLDRAALRGRIDRLARWLRLDRQGSLIPTVPPTVVVEDMLAFPDCLPLLKGVVGRPTVLPDGTLDATPGYQTAVAQYYAPAGLELPPVPERPSPAELQRAVDLLAHEWLGQFPFADASSRTHVIAAVVTPFARELFSGGSPLFAVDAPAPGSGKGYIATSIGIITTGQDPTATTEPRDDEELRKRITSLLMGGSEVIVFDNVKRRLDSGVLAMALTAPTWSDRLLSTNRIGRYPNNALWAATGNNLQLDGELARRTVWCRLDPHVDRAWLRTGFINTPFLTWVRKERAELVWAALTLCRHWLSCGSPRWTGVALGSFEDWCEVLGGIMEAAGLGGFLANQDELYSRVDLEGEEWRKFTHTWWEHFGKSAEGVASLFPIVREYDLLTTVFANSKDGAGERSLKTKLGAALRKQVDRRFGDFTIRRVGDDSKSGGALYRLELAEPRADEVQGSAEVPPQNGPPTDSMTEPSGPSEPFPPANARDDAGIVDEAVQEGGEDEVPEVQKVPPSDSQQALLGAEPAVEPLTPLEKVPLRDRRPAGTCPECGTRPVIDGRSCFRCDAEAYA